MSVSLYNTGVSGLLASQQQLATTGNNIANVNTEGYNRQRAEQNASAGLFTGGKFIGGGTYIEDIRRVYDQFSYKEQMLSQTNLSHADALKVDLSQLDEMMTFSGGAIDASIDKFYEAVNSIADNPSDVGLRNMAINQAKILSNDFNSINDNVNQMVKNTNGEIAQIASHITDISNQVAAINEQILYGQHSPESQSNTLLDSRDQLVNDLSQYMSVTTIVDDLGLMSVMIGNGATLVAGITPLGVGVNAGDPDSTKPLLTLVGANGAVDLKGSAVGGVLAAKYEFRDEHLAKVHSEVNLLSMAIADTLNTTQHSGLDLAGEQGLDFFADINRPLLEQSRVLTPSQNTGDLEATLTIADVSKLTTDEFMIEYDGVNYSMTNLNDGSTLNIGSPGAINNATLDTYGFEFVEGLGTPNANDFFILKPNENSAALMKVTLENGAGIAASSAIEATPAATNNGGGSVQISQVNDPIVAQNYASANNLTVDIYDNGAGAFDYRVYNAQISPITPIASGSYLPGSNIVVDLPPSGGTPVFQLEITGSPTGANSVSPETFSIADSFGVGNNKNALVLSLTQEKGIVNGGKDTFNQSLNKATASVGSKAKSAELTESTAQALFTQAYNRNQSTSGVNLDEEAADLLRYQQAYQAASQIITVANTIFDTLLQAVR